MAKPPALPVGKTLLFCRKITQDPRTGELTLFSPLSTFVVPAFPVELPVSVYMRLSEFRGRFELAVEIRDFDGSVGQRIRMPGKDAECEDPLKVITVVWRDIQVVFPKPGRFEVALVAEGHDLITEVVTAALGRTR